MMLASSVIRVKENNENNHHWGSSTSSCLYFVAIYLEEGYSEGTDFMVG